MKAYCTETRALSALWLLLALTGCQEMTFKAGAGPGDFTAAEKACRAEAAGAEESYERCMNARGFQVHRRSESIFAGGATAATPAPEAMAASTPLTEAPTASPAATPAPAKKSPSAPPAPTGPIEVSSWWKFGGTAGEFDASRKACIAELNEPPSATANENIASPALVACLRKAGWFGIAK